MSDLQPTRGAESAIRISMKYLQNLTKLGHFWSWHCWPKIQRWFFDLADLTSLCSENSVREKRRPRCSQLTMCHCDILRHCTMSTQQHHIPYTSKGPSKEIRRPFLRKDRFCMFWLHILKWSNLRKLDHMLQFSVPSSRLKNGGLNAVLCFKHLEIKGYFEYKIHILCEKRPFYGLSSRDASQKSYFVWSTFAWLENISASVGSVQWRRSKRNAIPPFQAIPMVFHFAGCWRADGGQNSKGALPTMIWEVLWRASDVIPILGRDG